MSVYLGDDERRPTAAAPTCLMGNKYKSRAAAAAGLLMLYVPVRVGDRRLSAGEYGITRHAIQNIEHPRI
ncbi:hypothetical protein DAPPUDRAFT_251901 [Daphnia pulex]|uniref:Uncharacterized protein n=1 Tax=Daphnia pulex TaxID=6669 RepID=E9H1M9_DAPPU|nr:hypothetical protein DAPPUDRAFT_251901 [Daphnia pulex]|eukprot:EFX74378.1 hypothetical protein DAPPUDRAFT_251901 [Daphnia pulex]